MDERSELLLRRAHATNRILKKECDTVATYEHFNRYTRQWSMVWFPLAPWLKIFLSSMNVEIFFGRECSMSHKRKWNIQCWQKKGPLFITISNLYTRCYTILHMDVRGLDPLSALLGNSNLCTRQDCRVIYNFFVSMYMHFYDVGCTLVHIFIRSGLLKKLSTSKNLPKMCLIWLEMNERHTRALPHRVKASSKLRESGCDINAKTLLEQHLRQDSAMGEFERYGSGARARNWHSLTTCT